MDPKNLSQLDPKLREAYERVMGTNAPSSTPQTATTPITPPLQASSVPAPFVSQLPPLPPQSDLPGIPPAPPVMMEQSPQNTFPQAVEQPLQDPNLPQTENPVLPQNMEPVPGPIPSAIPQHETPHVPQGAEPTVAKTPDAVSTPYADKSKGKFTPVLIALGLIVFFVVWAFLWIKILGL